MSRISITILASIAAQAPDMSKDLLRLEHTAKPGEIVSFSPDAPAWSFAPDGLHLVRGSGPSAKWVSLSTFEESDPPPEHARPTPSRAERERALDALLGAGAELSDPSPDGQLVAFVRANDLWLAKADGSEQRALTRGGSEELLFGKLDWVYQEEVYGRGRFRAFWWSPDSSRIAFLALDTARVPIFPLVDDLGAGSGATLELQRYPKPGDPNPIASLHVVEVATGERRAIDLERFAAVEPLIVRVDWYPDSGALAVMVQDRAQRWLELLRAEVASGEATRLWREESATWVGRSPSPEWLADGRFLLLSERSGNRRIQLHAPSGELVRAIPDAPYDVERILAVDEERGLLWFSAESEGALSEHALRVGLDGSGLVQLTHGAGRHTATLSPDRRWILDARSSIHEPPSVALLDAEGRLVRELGRVDVPALAKYRTSAFELHRVAARDGFELDVALLKPVPFDPARSYPVWLFTYSGPNAPSIRGSWSGDAWHQFLAQQGVLVFQVNVRTASGRGMRDTQLCYGRLGEQELADLEDALDWLVEQPFADGARVGIGGRSYGGFMAAYALTRSERFVLGIAECGVHDWRLYDSIYTERYMGLLADNAEGYARTSVIEAAARLSGHLVLIHGTLDDNVHPQNTLRLAHALQKAGRSFELMLYPRSRHRVSDPDLAWHKRRLEWSAIREHLRPSGPPDAPLEAR